MICDNGVANSAAMCVDKSCVTVGGRLLKMSTLPGQHPIVEMVSSGLDLYAAPGQIQLALHKMPGFYPKQLIGGQKLLQTVFSTIPVQH